MNICYYFIGLDLFFLVIKYELNFLGQLALEVGSDCLISQLSYSFSLALLVHSVWANRNQAQDPLNWRRESISFLCLNLSLSISFCRLESKSAYTGAIPHVISLHEVWEWSQHSKESRIDRRGREIRPWCSCSVKRPTQILGFLMKKPMDFHSA